LNLSDYASFLRAPGADDEWRSNERYSLIQRIAEAAPQDELMPNRLLDAGLKDFERGRILRAAGGQDAFGNAKDGK